jgi:hypothetical protein
MLTRAEIQVRANQLTCALHLVDRTQQAILEVAKRCPSNKKGGNVITRPSKDLKRQKIADLIPNLDRQSQLLIEEAIIDDQQCHICEEPISNPNLTEEAIIDDQQCQICEEPISKIKANEFKSDVANASTTECESTKNLGTGISKSASSPQSMTNSSSSSALKHSSTCDETNIATIDLTIEN